MPDVPSFLILIVEAIILIGAVSALKKVGFLKFDWSVLDSEEKKAAEKEERYRVQVAEKNEKRKVEIDRITYLLAKAKYNDDEEDRYLKLLFALEPTYKELEWIHNGCPTKYERHTRGLSSHVKEKIREKMEKLTDKDL